jgi:hypothetical protein
MVPKGMLANNLWIGDVPSQLAGLTIPEQLLIACYHPQCYIFKLFPHNHDSYIPIEQLHTGMARNASLFELNRQDMVRMLEGQFMPLLVVTLALIIAITFIGSKKLLMDWLKKTFQVRRDVIHEALVWLQKNNSIYMNIHIDRSWLNELPEDDVPYKLLSVIRRENDDEVLERERESYVCQKWS